MSNCVKLLSKVYKFKFKLVTINKYSIEETFAIKYLKNGNLRCMLN